MYQLANQVSDITVLVTESFVFGIFYQSVNFTAYNDFKHSVTTSVLIKFCKLFLCNAYSCSSITVYCIPLLQCKWPYGPFVK